MNCKHHPERRAEYLVELSKTPICDECAALEKSYGLMVVPIKDEWPELVA